MSETKKITNIITPNGEDLLLTDSEAVHKENNIITEKITLANLLEFVPSDENTDSSLPTPVLSMDETNGGLRINGKVVLGNSTNVASGANSHAEGIAANSYSCKAIGNGSHSEGAATGANGDASHSEGYNTEANGNFSHTEGVSTHTGKNNNTGMGAHAEGNNTIAYGVTSHTEGYRTITGDSEDSTKGSYAHAEGHSTNAKGNSSHSEGYNTEASGDYAHSEGHSTKALNSGSHSEGYNTFANHMYSHVEGQYTKTSRLGQHVSGRYNTDNSNALFIIGNGTSDENRKNALEVLADGTINLSSNKAKITNVANPTDDYDAANKWYIDNKFIFTIDNILNIPYINTEGVTFLNNTINLENGSITFYFGNCFVQGTYQKNLVIIVIDGVEVQSESGLLNLSINTLTIYPENIVGNITFDDLIITNNKNTNFILSSSLSSYINQLEQRIATLEQQFAAQSNS